MNYPPVDPEELKEGQEVLIKATMGKLCNRTMALVGYPISSVAAILPSQKEEVGEGKERTNFDDLMDISELDECSRKFMVYTCNNCKYKKEMQPKPKEQKIDFEGLKYTKCSEEFNRQNFNKLVDLVEKLWKERKP